MSDLIWVLPGEANATRVALFERHPDHPGGEIFVAGSEQNPDAVKPVQVARTSGVEQALQRGSLQLVDPPKPARKKRSTAKKKEPEATESPQKEDPLPEPEPEPAEK